MLLQGLAQRLLMAVVILGLWIPAGMVQAQPAPPKPKVQAAPLPSLDHIFADRIEELQHSIKKWQSRVEASAAQLDQTTRELNHLEIKVASLKATMALQKTPLAQVQALKNEYTERSREVKEKLKDLSQEIKALEETQKDYYTIQNSVRVQISIIQNKTAAPLPASLQQLYLSYLERAGEQDGLAARVLKQLQQRQRLLEREHELVAGLVPPLRHLESAWQQQLLKRPSESVSYGQQVVQTWNNLAAIPPRVWKWAQGLVTSGSLSAFIWINLAPILGLLGFIVLVGWGTRRLNRTVRRRFQAWRERGNDLEWLPLSVLGQTLVANLFGLGMIVWLGVFFWSFNLIGSDPAQLIILGLGTLWALRLVLQWIQEFFAGPDRGGVLALEPDVAGYYRRSLKLFAAYLFLGVYGLKSVWLLDIPDSSRLFVEHFFLVGVLVWGLWLLRRQYLERLMPQLTAPTWLHRPLVSRIVRALLLVLAAVIILADLLGFQNLSFYLAQAAAWTFLGSAFFWFLWLVGENLILHLLHPASGRAARRFSEKTELVQRLYTLSRWLLSLILGAAVALTVLSFWGVRPREVAAAFQWMTWGPKLGPVKLTTLSVIGVILAFYLGFLLSRLVRSLLMIRIFPHSALDSGVQYTISTTVHYVFLIIATLIALTILGFPLTSLALVFGALGVGIGFGLQNIVNNFLSGLILLFERPIKVGDMLVIDGQWGLVKEIRVRSTIFETFDRCVLVIPNSDLVSNKVFNWTHYGPGINRLTLKVGVSYDSDVRQVTQVITEVCKANPRVVPDPPPQIYFAVYGDSSLDFTIWVHLWTPSDRIPATHEINSAIFEAFNELGIEIPFPQRDLHVKQWPAVAAKPADGQSVPPPEAVPGPDKSGGGEENKG